MMTPRPLRLVVILCALLLLAGCGRYTLSGKVIEGDYTSAMFVPADDPRVAVPGVGGAEVTLIRDPDSLSREIAGTTRADDYGLFTMPVEGIGAGWMVEDWLVRAERSGFANAVATITLPANPHRHSLLITIRRGQGSSLEYEDENLWEEVERYK